MSKRIRRNMNAIKALARANTATQRAMISTANKDLILSLVELSSNLIKGNVHLTKRQFNQLKGYNSHLKRLVKSNTSERQRRQLLQKGGFLGALLKPLLGLLFT